MRSTKKKGKEIKRYQSGKIVLVKVLAAAMMLPNLVPAVPVFAEVSNTSDFLRHITTAKLLYEQPDYRASLSHWDMTDHSWRADWPVVDPMDGISSDSDAAFQIWEDGFISLLDAKARDGPEVLKEPEEGYDLSPFLNYKVGLWLDGVYFDSEHQIPEGFTVNAGSSVVCKVDWDTGDLPVEALHNGDVLEVELFTLAGLTISSRVYDIEIDRQPIGQMYLLYNLDDGIVKLRLKFQEAVSSIDVHTLEGKMKLNGVIHSIGVIDQVMLQQTEIGGFRIVPPKATVDIATANVSTANIGTWDAATADTATSATADIATAATATADIATAATATADIATAATATADIATAAIATADIATAATATADIAAAATASEATPASATSDTPVFDAEPEAPPGIIAGDRAPPSQMYADRASPSATRTANRRTVFSSFAHAEASVLPPDLKNLRSDMKRSFLLSGKELPLGAFISDGLSGQEEDASSKADLGTPRNKTPEATDSTSGDGEDLSVPKTGQTLSLFQIIFCIAWILMLVYYFCIYKEPFASFIVREAVKRKKK